MKRKSILYRLVFVLFLGIGQGCNKTENSEPAKSLHEDQSFVLLVNQTEDLIKTIKFSIEQNKLSQADVQNSLTKLRDSNKDEAEQLLAIEKLLGSTVSLKIKDYSTKFAEEWKTLNNRYKI
jgi:hypothetical protein